MLKRIVAMGLAGCVLSGCLLCGCSKQLGSLDLGDVTAQDRTLSEYERYVADKQPASAAAEISIPGAAYDRCEGYTPQIVAYTRSKEAAKLSKFSYGSPAIRSRCR